ncbi:MAG: hypothetical protein EPN57_00900 [Paraburkholderia sp.]|nr:MAG: hypothetical protein EPN57_00900 [Paraburkholderia sp.]
MGSGCVPGCTTGVGVAAGEGVVRIAAAKRIGLSREMHAPLRFYEPGSALVSGPKRLLQPLLRLLR